MCLVTHTFRGVPPEGFLNLTLPLPPLDDDLQRSHLKTQLAAAARGAGGLPVPKRGVLDFVLPGPSP